MAAVIGMIVDLSGTYSKEEVGKWACSVLKVSDELIQHDQDVSSKKQFFDVGIGASILHKTFDKMGTVTVEQCNKMTKQNSDGNLKNRQTKDRILNDIFGILETNGARNIRKWATKDLILDFVPSEDLLFIHEHLESDRYFLHEFVHNYLPPACRDLGSITEKVDGGNQIFRFVANVFNKVVTHIQDMGSSLVSFFKAATTDDIQAVLKRARSYVKNAEKDKIKVNNNSLVSVETLSEVIHGCHGGKEEKVTKIQRNELTEAIKPFLYVGTLFESLKEAAKLLSMSKYDNRTKLLFILSDGYQTDYDDLDRIVGTLKRTQVSVVSCYVTKNPEIQPKRLYCEKQDDWECGADVLFELSSVVETQQLPRTIFRLGGWKVDTENNETKLFLQVYCPDHIRDVFKLASDVVRNQDNFSAFLASVDLEMYMYQSLHELEVGNQEEKTCYANASATVIHLAMKRMLVRSEFNEIRDEMISLYGNKKGANTFTVLRKICPKYRLRCRKVNINGAKEAVSEKRPVVAQFALTDAEWMNFRNFYEMNAEGILTEKDLNIRRRGENVETRFHAVVFTSYNSKSLRFMNSWGIKWADKGFFRVANAKVLNMEFFDLEEVQEEGREIFQEPRLKVC